MVLAGRRQEVSEGRGTGWHLLMRAKHYANALLLVFLLALAACQKPTSPSDQGSQPREIVTRSGAEMVLLPGGQFIMGAGDGNPDEAPPHKVSVSPLLMDKYPVTQEMFAKLELPDPSHWTDNPRKPVERIRWRAAKEYCNERSRAEGLKPCYDEKTPDWPCDYAASGYRLPTEAEWEYAARGGGEGPYEFGPAENLRQYGWYAENSGGKTHPVGGKKPTRWGLHEMYGNVSQWCEDAYDPAYYASSPAADPAAPSPGQGRQAGAPRRQLEGQRRCLPGNLSPRRTDRRRRRLLQHRLLRLSLRAAAEPRGTGEEPS